MTTSNDVDVREPSNYVVLTLRAVTDGEVRYAASGCPWAYIRAFLSNGKDKTTNEFRPSLFFTVKAFGNYVGAAVWAIAELTKGDRFTVKGRLGLEQWDKDGEKHQTLVILASSVQAFAAERAKLEDEPA